MATENIDDVTGELDEGGAAAPELPDDVEIIIADDEETTEDTGDDTEASAEAPAPEEDASEEEPVASAEAEEEDAELASMPSKVKKRFEREKRLRNTIIGERDQARTVAAQAIQRIQATEAETQTLRRQNAALQKQFAETLEYAYDRDISLKAAELRRAREDGNYDAELKASSDLDTLRFQQNQVRQAKATLPAVDADPAPQQAAPQRQAPAQQSATPPAPLAVQWIEKNKLWFNSPKFTGHRAFALAADQQLVAEGYDKMTPEYYTELDRRVDEAFPTLRRKPTAKGGPVAPVGGGSGGSSPAGKKVIKITKVDLHNMQRFGLDPNNKEHLREYARNKAAA